MTDEWAGIPMPLDGQPLTLCPKYPHAEGLSMIGRPPEPEGPSRFEGAKMRNRFYSHARKLSVLIFEHEGKIDWRWEPAYHGLGFIVKTLGASFAWGIEQEGKAVQLLGELVTHVAFKQYMLTGMFLEKSKRSGLTYLFRRLRPTVVIDAREGRRLEYRIGATEGRWSESDDSTIRTTLCMHPIGHYEDSWAGALCPTDDVIAHLLMMRGDEVMFWRKANHHPPHLPNAGLS